MWCFSEKKEIQEIISSIESKEKNIDSEILKDDSDNKLLKLILIIKI